MICLRCLFLAFLLVCLSARAAVPSGLVEVCSYTIPMGGGSYTVPSACGASAASWYSGYLHCTNGDLYGPYWEDPAPIDVSAGAVGCDWYGGPSTFATDGVKVFGYGPASPASAASSAALTWSEASQLSWGVVAAWAAAACLLYLGRVFRA